MKNTQLLYIFSRENPQNSAPQNGPRRGLDFIGLVQYNIKYNMHHCNKKVLAFAPVPAVKLVQMYCFP